MVTGFKVMIGFGLETGVGLTVGAGVAIAVGLGVFVGVTAVTGFGVVPDDAFVTVTRQRRRFFPILAVMVAVPAFFAVTFPFLLTVAIFFLLERHVTFCLLPFTLSL